MSEVRMETFKTDAAGPSIRDEAERLLGYWDRHGDNPEAVARWAIEDMLGILRYIVESDQ